MRCLRLSLSAAALVLTVASCPACASAEDTTVVFGDSLSVGTAGQLAAMGRRVLSLGSVGWGFAHPDWRERALRLGAASHGAGRVVLFVGTNDQTQLMETGAGGGSVSRAFGTLEWVRLYLWRVYWTRAAVAVGVPVVWVGQPIFCNTAFDARARIVDRVLRSFSSWRGDTYLQPPSGCDRVIRAGDGVHFTPLGYRAIALAVDQAPIIRR